MRKKRHNRTAKRPALSQSVPPTSLQPLFDAMRTLPPDQDFEAAVRAVSDLQIAAVEHEAKRLGLLNGPLAEEAAEALRIARNVAEEHCRACFIHPDNPQGSKWEPSEMDVQLARLRLFACYLNLQHSAPGRPHAALCADVARLYGLHAAAVDQAIPHALAWVQAVFETALTAEGEVRAEAQMRLALWRSTSRTTALEILEAHHAAA